MDADEVFSCRTLEAAMLTAAMCNRAECIPALLAAKGQCEPSLDGQDSSGMTPLMIAALFGSTEVRQVLHTSLATLHDSRYLQP